MTSAPAIGQHHRVVLYDLRGHGLSERPESGYTPQHHLADLERVTTGIDRFALVGHSFGALLSLQFARLNPGRVSGVFCVDPPIGGHLRDLDEEDVRPATLRRHGRTLAQTTLAQDLADVRRMDTEDLGDLACPVAVVFGSRSPYSRSADLVGDIIGTEHVAVIEGGHSLHVDARDEVTARILAFLETVS
jgi:pimeloyl-ACP methyl ester carboxylesterase